jgi:hypothetical protein
LPLRTFRSRRTAFSYVGLRSQFSVVVEAVVVTHSALVRTFQKGYSYGVHVVLDGLGPSCTRWASKDVLL